MGANDLASPWRGPKVITHPAPARAKVHLPDVSVSKATLWPWKCAHGRHRRRRSRLGMQIEDYMLHYYSCFSLPWCASALALSQGIKRDGGDCNGSINSRLLAEGSEGERPLGGEGGQRPEKVPPHYIPLALCHWVFPGIKTLIWLMWTNHSSLAP